MKVLLFLSVLYLKLYFVPRRLESALETSFSSLKFSFFIVLFFLLFFVYLFTSSNCIFFL